MSVMLLCDTTYNRVINTLNLITYHTQATHHQDTLRRYTQQRSSKGNTGFALAILFSRAHNWRSYKIRYYDSEMLPYEKLVYTHGNDDGTYENIWALLKSLECIQYQIETEKGDHLLVEIIDMVKKHAIALVPEYENAAWGE